MDGPAMEPEAQMRNLRDFLMVYNRMTEICFQRCSSNFNYRTLTMDEERCVDNCAGKLIRSNHRLMGTYVQLMPRMVQRRMEEMESKTAEAAAAASAAAETSPITSTPVAASASTQTPPPLPPAGPDAGPVQAADVSVVSAPPPDQVDSVFQPAAAHIPLELDAAAVSKLTAATALAAPAAETSTPLGGADAANGPSPAAVSPPSAVAGMFSPSSPMMLSEDVPVSPATHSLSGADQPPVVSLPRGQ